MGLTAAQITALGTYSTNIIMAINNVEAKKTALSEALAQKESIKKSEFKVINKYKGRITEFLGDGYIALFIAKENKQVYDAHNAAKDCIKYLSSIVNSILKERYNLPELKAGIGLAYSKAIVTLIGNGDDVHAKAIGECVYRASKLSKGYNEIRVNERLRLFWSKSEDGKLKFNEFVMSGLNFKGYKLM